MSSVSIYMPHFEYLLNSMLREGLDRKTIVDMGCGFGRWGHMLRSCARIGGDKAYVIGCDLFLPYLKVAKKYNPYDGLIRCDMRFPPFREKSLDVCLAFEVIEHLEKKDAKLFINEIMKITKRYLVVSTPIGTWKQENLDANIFESHRSFWQVADLQKLGFMTYELGPEFLFWKVSQKIGVSKLVVFLGNILSKFTTRPTFAFMIAVKYVD